MAIKLLGLRPYFSDKYLRKKVREEWFTNDILTHKELFKNLPEILTTIPESEKYNLFYSVSHLGAESRKAENFLHCDIVGFDIDDVATIDQEQYLAVIQDALKVDLNKCAVIWSGNGYQIIIQLQKSVGKDFFSDNKDNYKKWCNQIDQALATAGLPGHADPVIFEPARVLRVPGTFNIKPMEEADNPDKITAKKAYLIYSDLEYCGWSIEIEAPANNSPMIKTHAPVDIASVMSGCAFMKYAKENAAKLSEPVWKSALGVTTWFPDNDQTSHEISKPYSGYSFEETQEKCDRIKNETSGPRLCESIGHTWNGCQKCPHYGKVKTPAQIKSPEVKVQERLHELAIPDEKKPTEMQIAYQLFKIYGVFFDPFTAEVFPEKSTLCQQNGDLFSFNGTYWEKWEESEINSLKRKIGLLYNYKANSSKIESTYRTFIHHTPHPLNGLNLYSPNPFAINLQNGTLHLIEEKLGKYRLEFKGHDKSDYLTNVIDADYDPEFKETNTEFEALLQRIFKDDYDFDEKIKALAQMFGGAILPAFPHLFFLHGVAGGGKSTLCIILSNLLDTKNICSVQPHQFSGFQMESMAGKLVNMVTDVSSKATISDDVVKQIEDRVEFRIQRKNKEDIYAPLPAIHIFGANELPKNFDGASKAHGRRWTFLPFNNSQTANGQKYYRDFGHHVFKSNPQGILNFAIKGLIDLIDNGGIYCNPESGKTALGQWENENDIIELFFDDFGDGCLEKIEKGPDLKLLRTDLWSFFEEWRDEAGRKHSKMTRSGFYKVIEAKGIRPTKINGNRYYKGIGRKDENEPARF